MLLTVILTAIVTAAVTGLICLLAQQRAPEKHLERTIPHLYEAQSEHFRHIMDNLAAPRIHNDNRITPLINGREIFPAMLAAIRGAKRTINLETFIYWSGEIADEFADALSERAADGLEVNVIIDWLGSKPMEKALVERMRGAGATVIRYHEPSPLALNHLNQRTHRKLLIVDGRVAFTGGVGIADVWRGNAESGIHWRDSHFQIEGPIVAQLQAAFLDNWIKVESSILQHDGYFPALEPVGDAAAQITTSSAGGGNESARLMFLLALAAAKSQICISTAYFVADALSIETLLQARRRGVRVRIIVPGPHIDKDIVRVASRRSWKSLLEADVEIYEYQETMFHVKCITVDNCWTSVGSANFDYRSFFLNDEVNINVFDRDFAATQIEQFEHDLQRCKRITLEDWNNRSYFERLKERCTDLVRGQL